tara:strand:- start:447 stop:1256 length:810 start_codon:yes stop_codon:yes gene_type:complete
MINKKFSTKIKKKPIIKSMWLRLRQICLVARELAPVEKQLKEVFNVNVCYRDPGVKIFGLENVLFPIGNQFLEVVSPVEINTTAGRYLDRRGGDGGYMVITQCDDHPLRKARVKELGIRIAHSFESDEYLGMQLHPKDTGATFFEIDQQLGPRSEDFDGPWNPAGPNWQKAKNTEFITSIVGADIQCNNPDEISATWSEISEIPCKNNQLQLENSYLSFTSCIDGRPEGLGGLDLSSPKKEEVLNIAEGLSLRTGDSQIYICGTRFNLI